MTERALAATPGDTVMRIWKFSCVCHGIAEVSDKALVEKWAQEHEESKKSFVIRFNWTEAKP